MNANHTLTTDEIVALRERHEKLKLDIESDYKRDTTSIVMLSALEAWRWLEIASELLAARETIRDREAEILRIRTHENRAAHLLDQQLSPEDRARFQTLCDEVANLQAALDARGGG